METNAIDRFVNKHPAISLAMLFCLPGVVGMNDAAEYAKAAEPEQVAEQQIAEQLAALCGSEWPQQYAGIKRESCVWGAK